MSIMFGQMDGAHDKQCALWLNWAGEGAIMYLEICEQGVSGRRGRLASMHTSTGDGKDTRWWVEVVGKLCSGDENTVHTEAGSLSAVTCLQYCKTDPVWFRYLRCA